MFPSYKTLPARPRRLTSVPPSPPNPPTPQNRGPLINRRCLFSAETPGLDFTGYLGWGFIRPRSIRRPAAFRPVFRTFSLPPRLCPRPVQTTSSFLASPRRPASLSSWSRYWLRAVLSSLPTCASLTTTPPRGFDVVLGGTVAAHSPPGGSVTRF